MEAQEFFHNTFCPQFPSDNNNLTPSNPNNLPSAADHFIVEDFFDFSNNDDPTAAVTDATFDSLPATDDSPTVTPVDSTNTSNFPTAEATFSADLSVPFGEQQYDDLAELEWLSKFAEESFSSEDMEKLQLISGVRVQNEAASSETRDLDPNRVFNPQVSVRGKARSKRSRGGSCNWAASRLAVLSPTATTSSSSPHPDVGKKPAAPRRRDDGGEGRKCLHCATDKTPQWRTGPMGPKTLCNACGVRYKSGRLVPEYRPAASPTFVLTKHSNSHRKVLELRRQKEMVKVQHQQLLQLQHQQNMMFDVASNGDDYLIHQHVGPDFTHLI